MSSGPDSANREEWQNLLRAQAAQSDKNWWATFCFSFLLGILGADRFYLGYSGVAALKLLTLGGFGILWLIALVQILKGTLREADGGSSSCVGYSIDEGCLECG